MSDYKQGQEDLIRHIKNEIEKILDKSEGVDVLIDVANLLKNLKPID